MTCVTCNQPVETRWPHLPPQNINECGPLGCNITGRSAPESDFRYPDYYKTGPFQGSLRDSSIGKIQIGRKDHGNPMEAPCCEKYGDRYPETTTYTQVIESGSLYASDVPVQAPSKLPFDTGSFAIGALLGLFGGIFVWTATGRGVAHAVGTRARRRIER
jgi:hypothetical protein